MDNLFSECENGNTLCKNICAGLTPEAVAARKFLETLWGQYELYADRNFRSSMRKALFNNFWEMYLTCALLDEANEHQEFIIKKHKTEYTEKSPDLLLQYDQQRYWFEAVAPMQGKGKNKVPDMCINKIGQEYSPKAQNVPDEAIILRLRSAIHNKVHQYQEHRRANVIQPNDAYVIAISEGQIQFATLEENIPRIVKAVLPFGSPQVVVNINTMETEDNGYTYRSEVKKSNGSSVGTDIFLCQDYNFISAVLYSNAPIPFQETSMDDLGKDFVIVHNPLALNPLPQNFIKRGREVTVIKHEFTCEISIKKMLSSN